MKRRGWILAGAAAIAAAGTLVAVLRPRARENLPLAELVPSDAVFYAGFTDYRQLEELSAQARAPWAQELRTRLDPARAHLSGAVALYLDRELQWVFLTRLTRASALLAGSEVENGAVVAAQTPEALARHKGRRGALADLPDFQALRSRFFLNLQELRARGRLRDFSAVGFELDPGPPWVVRGRALYRGGLLRLYLQDYVQAARHGVPEGSPPFQAALAEHFPRLWDEVLHELSPVDREKVDREAHVLARDILDGQSVRDFLRRLGPVCGVAVVPTPHKLPGLVAWIDLPDERTRERLARMLHRAASDAINLRRERGQAPAFEISAEGSVWKIRIQGATAIRLGEGFSPAYRVDKNRLLITTYAPALTAPAVPPGDHHAAIQIEPASLAETARGLAGWMADRKFAAEAERSAALLHFKTFPPSMLSALRKQYPHAGDLAKYLETHRAQFEAKAIEELSRTPKYEQELARVHAEIDAWTARFSWLERVAVAGRFTGDGLQFELKATLRAEPR